MICYKTKKDIEVMREGGRIARRIMNELCGSVRAGITGEWLNAKAENLMRENCVVSSFLHYRGFPAHICLSINSEVVHGIPFHKTIKDKDILTLDLGIQYRGFHLDLSESMGVGNITRKEKLLLKTTKHALRNAVEIFDENHTLGDIGYCIAKTARRSGFSVVRELVGHGVGKDLHEDPSVPNFGRRRKGVNIRSGLVVAIEPMLTIGTEKVVNLDDGFTFVTKDGSKAAHFENTVAYIDGRTFILTE